MNLHVKVAYLKGKSFTSHKGIADAIHFRHDDQFMDVECSSLTDEQLDELYDIAKKRITESGARAVVQRISTYKNVRSNPSGQKIGKLESLATALKSYIEPSPNKWVFQTKDDGYALPSYVSGIEYHRASRNSPARVEMDLKAIKRGAAAGRDAVFYAGDVGSGKTVVDILRDKGFYLENPAIVAEYQAAVEVYKVISSRTGSQWSADGLGYASNNDWGYGSDRTEMKRDDEPATVVMDDDEDDDEDSHHRSGRGSSGSDLASAKFWRPANKKNDDDDGEDDMVAVPVHPYVKVFDLRAHRFVVIHVSNLSAYVYDKTAAAKLVLPQMTKDLVTILVEGSAEVLEDIVRGKTGGTIVIATGPPGTGKTLTAEVFSEQIERPLYVVQCSQLGTNEETVEKRLGVVLARASRWKAILLIDEADVYVHERGADIRQNAIVGVFLRVLEHYRGVLFLTSNRSTIIDDAIMSRATAWIKYEYPDPEQLQTIWKVLSEQYKTPLSNTLIASLVEAFPSISGRNVKNMLKLTRMLVRSRKGKPVDLKFFQYVSRFLDLAKEKE